MARYRLMLLEGVPAGHRGAADVMALPPDGVDPAVLRGALRGPIAQPVMLAASDDSEALQRILARLHEAGLDVCIFDDSTALIRLAETLRTALGFTRVKAVGAPAEGAVRARYADPTEQGPALTDPGDGRWRRMALLAAGLALPMVATLFLSGAFDGALSGEAPTAAPSSAEAAGGARSRRLAARAGAGQGDAPGPGEAGPRNAGGGAAAAGAPGGGGGDSVELTQDGADAAASPPAPAPPKRTARKAIAAVLALLLGLGSAGLLGELVERSTRTRSAATRRRIRRGVALAAGLGLVVAPVVVWQAWAASQVPVALAPVAPRPAPRPAPAASEEPRCPGGPFSRFVCRSGRGARRSEPRPFASMLTRFRRQSQQHADAGTEAAVDAAVAPRERHASRRHRRRHHEREAARPVASSDAAAVGDATAAQAAPAPVAPPADASVAPPASETPPETLVVAAPPTPEPTAPTVTEAPEAPPPPPSPPPKGLPRGWFAGWLLAGLVVGSWVTPGWRRLGRS